MSITHNIEFHLGNELARLEKADSYDLFILKSCIEKEMIERRHHETSEVEIHQPMDDSSLEHKCDIELKRPCGSVLKINALPISVITTLIPSFVGS